MTESKAKKLLTKKWGYGLMREYKIKADSTINRICKIGCQISPECNHKS